MPYKWVDDDPELPLQPGPKLDADKKYVMYHGTTWEAARAIQTIGFQQSADGILGRGVYLSRDPEKASRYPINHPESDKVVIKVVVNVGKVIAINCKDHPQLETWHSQGFDTAWLSPNMVKRGYEEMCVWDPRRIRIIGTIYPRPVQTTPVQCGADGNTETESIRPYKWVEDDGDLPGGVIRLGDSGPESGREYVMYHVTTRQAAQIIQTIGFQQSADRMLGRGVYLSRDLEKASNYPINHPESDRVVIKVVVNVGKVVGIDHQNHPHQRTWSVFGIDTAWVPPGCGMVESGLEEICVWDPRRIRIIGTIQPRPVLR